MRFLQLLLIAFFFTLVNTTTASVKDFYQIKIYHLQNKEQEKIVEDYLKNAYLPALHRAKIANIGVFKPIPLEQSEKAEQLIYVFVPYPSVADYLQLDGILENDNKYLQDGANYLNASHEAAPYTRIETILLTAFEGSTNFTKPALNSPYEDRVYELRSYEGPTEKLYKNKVDMFNKGDEIGLFKRLGFNAAFYGEVIAGSRMPNLMYLTTFDNKTSRDAHWDAFGKDEYWKELSAKTEYQNNVSHINITFLYPVDYSDF